MAVFILWKNQGLTPRQALEQFKEKHPELADTPLTYAGRLDPMAEGLLIALGGDDIAKKDEYLALPKTYTAYIVFGCGTDTHDALGLSDLADKVPLIDESTLKKTLDAFIGDFTFRLPLYSSQPVLGKPLYQWAREGRIDIERPLRTVPISSTKLYELREMGSAELWEDIRSRIEKVSGDFRQEEILKRWESLLVDTPPRAFTSATVELAAGSGFYVRAFADELGKRLNTYAFVLHLVRTHIGQYSIDDAEKIL